MWKLPLGSGNWEGTKQNINSCSGVLTKKINPWPKRKRYRSNGKTTQEAFGEEEKKKDYEENHNTNEILSYEYVSDLIHVTNVKCDNLFIMNCSYMVIKYVNFYILI